MGYCDYHNHEKSGPVNGWYCNKAGRFVERSLYTRYCNDSIYCKRCPIYDPYYEERLRKEKEREEREKREREERERREREERERRARAEQERREQAERERRERTERERREQAERNRREEEQRRQSAQQSRQNIHHSSDDLDDLDDFDDFDVSHTPPPRVHSVGCLERILGFLSSLFFGGIALLAAGFFLMHFLGFLRASVSLDLALPEDVNPRDFSMEVVSHDPEEDFNVETKKMKKDGTCKVYMEKGANSVYLIHDDLKFTLFPDAVDGRRDIDISHDYSVIQPNLCRMLLIDLKDMEGGIIPADSISILDAAGSPMQWMPVEDSRIMVVIPDEWSGNQLTLTVQGYEPLTVAIAQKDRLEGMGVQLKPIG